MEAKVLVADDHCAWQELIAEALTKENITCNKATNKDEAIVELSNKSYEVVCLNWTLENKYKGLELLTYIKENHPNIRVVLISASFLGDVVEILETCSNLKQKYAPIIETCFNKDDNEEWQQKLTSKVKTILDHPKIRWAHLSDLHIESGDFHQDVVLDELSRDLSGFTPLDFIVVSGDITNSGNKNEFSKASEFLDKIVASASIDKKRLFLVPGNHDVNWNALDQIVNMGAQSFLISPQRVSSFFTSDQHHADRVKVFAKLQNYTQFAKRYFHDYPEKCPTSDKYYLNEAINKNGVGKITISSFNSAWSSAIHYNYEKKKADDLTHILIGEHQTNNCINFIKKENARLNIAIIHHPKNWLSEFDRERCWYKIENNFHLILHGHEHVTAASASLIGKALTFGVGASAQKDKTTGDDKYYNSHNRYHISEIDGNTGHGTQFLRRFSVELGRWIPDIETIPNGNSELGFDINF